jgi:hypothetical protein
MIQDLSADETVAGLLVEQNVTSLFVCSLNFL